MTLGTIIATRELALKSSAGIGTVLIEVGTPRESRRGDEWVCPWRITKAGRVVIREAAGVDALQALELVAQMINANLVALQSRRGGQLVWPDGSQCTA